MKRKNFPNLPYPQCYNRAMKYGREFCQQQVDAWDARANETKAHPNAHGTALRHMDAWQNAVNRFPD